MENNFVKLTNEDKEKIKNIVDQYKDKEGSMITMFHDVQKIFNNSLPGPVISYLSELTGMPETKIHGVLTFYTMFSIKKRGRNIIRLCDSPPCHLMGAENILECLCEELGIQVGETTKDGRFTLETTSCLGVCSVAPAMMINEEVFGHLTKEKIKSILEKFE